MKKSIEVAIFGLLLLALFVGGYKAGQSDQNREYEWPQEVWDLLVERNIESLSFGSVSPNEKVCLVQIKYYGQAPECILD